MDFDDVDNELIISKRTQIIEPILTVSSIKKLNENFRKSLVIELFWDDKIDYKIVDCSYLFLIFYGLFRIFSDFFRLPICLTRSFFVIS